MTQVAGFLSGMAEMPAEFLAPGSTQPGQNLTMADTWGMNPQAGMLSAFVSASQRKEMTHEFQKPFMS